MLSKLFNSCTADFYYKYRKFSPVSLKELLYGEIFFAERSELNDPYDTLVPYFFKADYGKYYRLLESIIETKRKEPYKECIKEIAEFLSKNDLSYEQLINKIESEEFADIYLKQIIGDIPESFLQLEKMKNRLKHETHKAVGRFNYISCFSKSCDNPIMWSHYAEEHKGFCMIFKPYNNSLYIDPLKNTDNGVKNENIRKYEFQDVIYSTGIKRMDGFLNFSPHVNGISRLSQKEIRDYWDEYKKSATVKYIDWEYEKEVRLIEPHWPEFVDENGSKKKSLVERIFYYDKTQLRGIIFGTKMKTDDKEEIISGIKVMREEIVKSIKDAGLLPPFVFYDAVQNPNEFKINKTFYRGLKGRAEIKDKSIFDEHIKEYEKTLTLYKNQNRSLPSNIVYK